MGLMTDEQKDKYYFCKNCLTEVIRFALNDRLTAEYYTTDSGEEYVDIVNRQGQSVKTVCVTADSLTALARDVLKVL